MAVMYTRVYTYTGQSKWTADARTAKWSDFKASGDTDKTIGQIISVQYEHYHGSGSDATWNLQGQLTFSGGGTLKSDIVSQFIDYHSSSGNSDVVKFVNTFTTLPTVAQFNSIVSVQTLSDGSSASNGVLSWKATSSNPIRVIVSFYEEPPWKYKPQIIDFEVKRGTSSGAVSDSGTKALLTIKLGLVDSSAAETITLRYFQGFDTSALGSVNLTSYMSALISGRVNYYGYVTYDFSTEADYRFELTFTAGDETATATAWLSNTFVTMHVAPYSTGGVSIGDLSTSSEGNPKFEVHHPAHFYEGIENFRGGVISELGATSSGTYKDGSVTFDAAYPTGTIPAVLLSFMSTSTAGKFGRCSVAVMSVTNTGFTFRFFNGDDSNRNPKFVYIAYGIPGQDISNGNSGGGGESGGGGTGDIISAIASRTALGAVQIGSGLDITTAGLLSLTASYIQATYTASQEYQGMIRFGGTNGYQVDLPIPLPQTARLRTGDYGTELPTSNLYNGRLFFLKES